MSRAKHPFRLKGQRWSNYRSAYTYAEDIGGPADTLDLSGVYPADMCAVFEEYSWKNRPVPGSPYDQIPLFWTPHQAARSMNLSLAAYIDAGFAPVMPGRNTLQRRPKAVVYNTHFYRLTAEEVGDPDDDGFRETDVVASAVSGMEQQLSERGIFVGRINTPFFVTELNGHGAGCTCPNNSSSVVCVTSPVTSIEDLWEIDQIDGDDINHQIRRLSGEPYEAGEILYITPINLLSLMWPYYTADRSGFGSPWQFAYLPVLRAAEVELLNKLGSLHDRCTFYSAVAGFDPFDGGQIGPWTHTKDVVLPSLASDVPYFDYDTTEPYSNGAENDNAVLAIAPFITLIRAKIQEFFNL